MNILVINAGSSSFKYQLINMDTKEALCSGLVERIGQSMGTLVYKRFPDTDQEEKVKMEKPFADHKEGMLAVMEIMVSADKGVIKDASELAATGHRVLIGEEGMKEEIVTPELKATINALAPLGPLHIPANLMGIEVMEELFPSLPAIAVFDTGFHTTMPEYNYTYPIKKELTEKHKIRRYGYHGTSHKFVSREAALFMGKKPEEVKVIVCHLGNGCSMSAVKYGECVNTTMGFTPLEGLMMGSRSGDVDPAVVAFLIRKEGFTPEQVDDILNKQSGFLGLCGMSDMRDIHDAISKGDKMAKLAFDMFCARVRKFIGAYLYELDGADAIVFTGGIGENDEFVREAVTANASFYGIELDKEENLIRRGEARYISTPNSRIPLIIMPTNEELEIALAVQRLI